MTFDDPFGLSSARKINNDDELQARLKRAKLERQLLQERQKIAKLQSGGFSTGGTSSQPTLFAELKKTHEGLKETKKRAKILGRQSREASVKIKAGGKSLFSKFQELKGRHGKSIPKGAGFFKRIRGKGLYD